jgi:pSer/pThr/pTyr-binding forkhead associated (FHA) protein
LEVVAGKAVGSSLVVADELVIGRHAEGKASLGGDDEISRDHARLTLDTRGVCAIEDLGSTNGTYVNGLKISSSQTLLVGDTVEVGATTLVVREVPADDASPAATTAAADEPAAQTSGGGAEAPTVPAGLPLELRLEVDFEAREVLLRLNDASEPVRLTFHDRAWRAQPSEPKNEQGDPRDRG